MSKYTLDETDTTGYFLPEDSHFRLAKLQDYLDFLRQLAQPRTHDEEERNRGPQISGMELAVCMEILAEQVEQVLDEVTWPAERQVKGSQPDARDEGEAVEPAQTCKAVAGGGVEDVGLAVAAQDGVDDEDEDDTLGDAAMAGQAREAAEAEGADPAEPAGAHFVVAMTMDQLDALNRLHDRLHAHGDLVFGSERADLADGTLAVLGGVISEDARAASELMDKVAEQQLPAGRQKARHVREAHASYGSPVGRRSALDAAVSVLPKPADVGGHPQAGTLH
ncbi:XAC0095 family protein [Luteimonas sp. SDU82]|uniref:XAC0095 family protein n=1 Tax=Luteimonas sp. SDU82 TaxID=3422592 RepID=UPI003EB8D256